MPIPEYEPIPDTKPAPPSLPTTASGPAATPPGKWGPYSGAADFTANMATILVALFCALILAVAAHAVVRHFLRRRRARLAANLPVTDTACKEAPCTRGEAITLPVLVFSRRGTNLAGDGPPDCAICLSEFAEGDRVRVIPACNHGFHVSCVEAWLVSRPSCPTCRSSCKADDAGVGGGADPVPSVAESTRHGGGTEEGTATVPSTEVRARMEEP